MRVPIICSVLLFCCIHLKAQNATDDFERVSKTYTTLHASMEVVYDLYAQHTGMKKVQSIPAKFYVWEKMIRYTMSEVDVFKNNKFVLSVDHEAQNMVLNKANPAFEKQFQEELLKLSIDSVLVKNLTITLVQEQNGIRTWRIQYATAIGGISHADIALSIADYRVSKIILYYDYSFEDIFNQAPVSVAKTDKPRLEIIYTNYTELKDNDVDRIFYAADFLTITKKGGVTLSDKYKQYQLANYYNIK